MKSEDLVCRLAEKGHQWAKEMILENSKRKLALENMKQEYLHLKKVDIIGRRQSIVEISNILAEIELELNNL
jgi:hypothetical protein